MTVLLPTSFSSGVNHTKFVFISVVAIVTSLIVLYNFSLLYHGHNFQFFRLKVPEPLFQIKTRKIIAYVFGQSSPEIQIVHSKWIVVTSISSPTPQIKKLAQIPGWHLLVVADKKTPNNWTYPNATVLDVDTQSNLGYNVLEYLPWNSYTRKMIGYLYAIQHGAQFIYDTDDDNAPDDPSSFTKDFDFDKVTRGLVLENTNNSSIVANPYAHFGQSSVWPRGFPLEFIGQEYKSTYLACQMNSPLIQQGVVNGDPDVDAIFRLTRKQLHTPLNIQFDNAAPPVILAKSVLTPFNSQNTIFHYDAFWSLLLPVTVAFRVTDIWRGYWAQPLLWAIGANLGFYPPGTTQIRNAHTYLRDFGEEDQLYTQAGILAKLLTEWKCQRSELYACMLELTTLMVNQDMWHSDEIKLLTAWIADLKIVGYNPPKLFNSNSVCLEDKPKTTAVFHGVKIRDKSKFNKVQPEEHRIQLRKFCNFTISDAKSHSHKNSSASSVIFPSTLLVVTFNIPHYENIWLLDIIYRHHFPNILYCGHLLNFTILDEFLTSSEFVKAKVNKFSFVHANVTNGYFAYECAMRAIDMKYNVNGYLVLSDDILLNFWNNGNYNPEEMWMLNTFGVLNVDLPVNSTGWQWWGSPYGLTATKRALGQLYSQGQSDTQGFITNRKEYGYNSSTAMVAESDIFYFPKSKENPLYEVGWVLRENEVFLEVSVPLLVSGLSAPNKLVHLPGTYLWGGGRYNPFYYFNKSSSVIHPVKPSQVIKLPKLREEFCKNYIMNLLD